MNRSFHMLQANYHSVKEILCMFCQSLPLCPVLPRMVCYAYFLEYHCLYKKKKKSRRITNTFSQFKNSQPDVIWPSVAVMNSEFHPCCLQWAPRVLVSPVAEQLSYQPPPEWDLYVNAFVQSVCLRFSALPAASQRQISASMGTSLHSAQSHFCSSSHLLLLAHS